MSSTVFDQLGIPWIKISSNDLESIKDGIYILFLDINKGDAGHWVVMRKKKGVTFIIDPLGKYNKKIYGSGYTNYVNLQLKNANSCGYFAIYLYYFLKKHSRMNNETIIKKLKEIHNNKPEKKDIIYVLRWLKDFLNSEKYKKI